MMKAWKPRSQIRYRANSQMSTRRAQVSHLCVMTACTAGRPNALVLSVLRSDNNEQ
jgi:hypothetical protein